MPLTRDNVTKDAVHAELVHQLTNPAIPQARTVDWISWQAPDPNGDFMRAFGDPRRRRTEEVVEVTTRRLTAPGHLEVILVPNTQNASIANLHGTIELKVGEVQV